MPKNKDEKEMVVEHVLEVRHVASGTFLDVRGYVADYIRNHKFLPHWKIDANVVNFRDEADALKNEGAFVGYKSAGYVVIDPKTRNFFCDRASAFWNLIQKNDHYKLPSPSRFGIRTKLFIPSRKSFDDINKVIYEEFFSEKARSLLGGKETDLQFTIDLRESGFNVRLIGGPIHKDEANQYFKADSDHFKKCGLFLDIDYFKTDELSNKTIPNLLSKAVDLMWSKAESIATGLGL